VCTKISARIEPPNDHPALNRDRVDRRPNPRQNFNVHRSPHSASGRAEGSTHHEASRFQGRRPAICCRRRGRACSKSNEDHQVVAAAAFAFCAPRVRCCNSKGHQGPQHVCISHFLVCLTAVASFPWSGVSGECQARLELECAVAATASTPLSKRNGNSFDVIPSEPLTVLEFPSSFAGNGSSPSSRPHCLWAQPFGRLRQGFLASNRPLSKRPLPREAASKDAASKDAALSEVFRVSVPPDLRPCVASSAASQDASK
jgi:hypothetical protein